MEPKTLGEIAKTLDRIAKILAGLLLKDMEEADQVKRVGRLKMCDFSNVEIARMLGTTSNTVNVAVHSLRKNKGKRKASRAKN